MPASEAVSRPEPMGRARAVPGWALAERRYRAAKSANQARNAEFLTPNARSEAPRPDPVRNPVTQEKRRVCAAPMSLVGLFESHAGENVKRELVVRDVQPGDAEAIVAILNPIIEAGIHTVFDTPFSVEAERAYIESFPARGVFLLAVDSVQRRVVGFQSMEPFATYTHAFDHVGVLGTYVWPGQRRRGVARALFRQTFEQAKRKGYEKIFTFVRGDNGAALAAYCSQGFSIVGTARKHAKVNGLYVDEILIEKFL